MTARRSLRRGDWQYAFRRTGHTVIRARVIDSAASLTFFAALTLFPSALTLISAFAIGGGDGGAVQFLEDLVDEVANGDAVETLRSPLEQLTSVENPGFALVIGLLLTLWTGSAYAGAFGRATNALYGVQEGRRILKFRALMALVAAVLVVGLSLATALVVGTPRVADAAGDVLGVGQPWVTIWLFARWPLLLALGCVMISVLYFFTPAVRRTEMRVFSWGSVLALLGWALASVAFVIYVTGFAHYDQLYGWLGGALVLLLWLYLSNFVLLLGAALDAEIVRVRQLLDGLPAEHLIQLPMRDTARNLVIARSLARDEEDGRRIREQADQERHRDAKHL